MKILIANKFFYPRGGDCIVAINTRQLLMDNGHDVRVFAMDYPENLNLAESESYASRVSFENDFLGKLKATKRIFGFGDIKKSFANVLEEFHPDVVHLNNIHSYISPVIGEIAASRGIKVVWTLHDYKLICPSYLCRTVAGEICERCVRASSVACIRNRCLKGGLLGSILAAAEKKYWNPGKLQKFITRFIAPSKFMAEMMRNGGFTKTPIDVICNFIGDEKKANFSMIAKEDHVRNGLCYIGRLSPEKGVETMIKASLQAGIQLKIAGDGPLATDLKNRYSSDSSIKFLGHLDANGVARLLADSVASIMPSECYDNNPLGVIESLSAGTPVIGAAIGGIPELIGENDGIVFPSGDCEALKRVIVEALQPGRFDNVDISDRALKRFSSETYYENLMRCYG